MRAMSSLLPVLLMIVGCGGQDPILERAESMAGEGGAAPAAAPPQPGAATAPAPGKPADPQPVRPGEPQPVQPGQPQPGVPQEPPPGGGPDGPAVTLKGTITVPGWKGGEIRIDVFDGDQKAAAGTGKRPSVVAQGKVAEPGPFELRVPQSADRVWIGAFADEDKNGRPGHTDPTGWYSGNPVSTGADRGGIELELQAPKEPPRPSDL